MQMPMPMQMQPPQPLRLLLVDDHALFREAMVALFSYQADFTVVGEAGNAASAVAQAHKLKPDLVLMDIDLPGEAGDDGVAATRQIKSEMPEIGVVMLTVYDDTERLLEAIKAGAQGYLVKNIRATELLEQLRGVARGEAAITRRMATRILDEFRRQDENGASNHSVEQEPVLTPRELEVLELVAAHNSNRQIADSLTISEYTVKNHIKSILTKLQLRSRHQAATYGVVRGWIRPADDTRRP